MFSCFSRQGGCNRLWYHVHKPGEAVARFSAERSNGMLVQEICSGSTGKAPVVIELVYTSGIHCILHICSFSYSYQVADSDVTIIVYSKILGTMRDA